MANRKDLEKSSGESTESGSRTRISNSKLARRARSFKDDFIDKISLIRSPGSMNNGSGSNSPKLKHRNRSRSPHSLPLTTDSYDSGFDCPLKDLESQVKQMQIALRYFQDVISKNKLEQLPGNGTIVLDTIANIHSVVLKSYTKDEQNSAIITSLSQVYRSLTQLIKLCDDVLIVGESALDKEHVAEIVSLVENAVQMLVVQAKDKITERENRSGISESSASSSRCSTISSDPSYYRVSLPEITMSPSERQLLEQTTQTVLERHGLSRIQSDNDDVPPPKPPLPDSWAIDESPPPLPPKKRNLNLQNTFSTTAVVPSSLSLERLSLKSDNSSVASFDSSSGGLAIDLPNYESTPKPVTRERLCSSSSSGVVSLRNSSHYFVEQQQLQQKRVHHSSSSFSTVDEVSVTTTAHSEIRSFSSSMLSTFTSNDEDIPPALPMKTRKMWVTRRENCINNLKSRSLLSRNVVSNGHSSENGSPPPLPLKKKHIMAYMEMFGNCSHENNTEFLHRSVDPCSLLQADWQNHEMILNSAQSCSFDMFYSSSPNSTVFSDTSSPPPALPPRRSQLNSLESSQSPTCSISPTSPVSSSVHSQIPVAVRETTINLQPVSPLQRDFTNGEFYEDGEGVDVSTPDPLAELDVAQWLSFKRTDEDGPDIRGGHPDALIVLATKTSESDFLYQKAFLTTYRTFVSPTQLIDKLIQRYQRFDIPSDPVRHRAAKDTFELLVRVVDDLTIMDLDEQVVEQLTEFVYELLGNGGLANGKMLRKEWIKKYQAKIQYHSARSLNSALTSQNIYTGRATLLEFKPEHMAEQMTLLDAELFNNIEIPEVLIWTQEQNEEKSPNLTRFTEHFNKMSYWARSRILEQNDAKTREKYVTTFIRIMKHLRKMNNFNSYLALLSALDSAPVRRLEWQKQITDGLKEYCALIDSSSSFRAYRQALAETQPPCIPYIGLVLQDLTFVHIGNSDYLSEGVINFSKRWQQFNIVENMKRFKKGSYNFKHREDIIAFFSNFDEFLSEEAMWQISETIKPRGTKKTNPK